MSSEDKLPTTLLGFNLGDNAFGDEVIVRVIFWLMNDELRQLSD